MNFAITMVFALLLSGCATSEPAAIKGKVVSCTDVLIDSKISSGIKVECLDGSQGAVLQSLRGPMIVNVWGSWCTTCLKEMPEFVSFYSKVKDKVQLVGIAVEERSPEDSKKFVIKHGMSWPNYYDRENKSRGYFGMGVPVTWFIDETGNIKYKKIGIVESEQELIDLTQKYLGIEI